MVWVSVRALSFLLRNIIHIVVLVYICWESTSFILHKLPNVWIPVTLTSCFISNTRMDYFLLNVDYYAFTI